MKVTVIKNFLHDRLGRVQKGSEIELPDFQARSLAEAGLVSIYATKVVTEKPAEPIVETNVETKPRLFGRKSKKSQELE